MIITSEELHEYTESLGFELSELHNMNIGKAEYIKETLNKIKRLNENEWIFLRFDSVHTHIKKNEYSNEDSRTVWEGFKKSCDYNLRFAQDRCDRVIENFDEQAAIDIVSSDKFMKQQVKTTSSFLTGESGITKTFETIANFICYAKFDNLEQEKEHARKRDERLRLERIKKKKRKESEERRIAELTDELRDVPSSKTRKLKHLPAHMNVVSVESIEGYNGIYAPDYIANYSKRDRMIKDGEYLEGFDNFWDRVSPKEKHDIPFYHNTPINYNEFAKSTMKQFHDEIDVLKDKSYNPERAKQISNLKTEMRTALEVLRKIINFNPEGSIDETIPHDSWEYLSLRDPETYKALLLGYSELKKKYHNKPSTTMWCLLMDFENLLQNTPLSEEEKVVVNYILETGITNYKDLQQEMFEVFGEEEKVSQRTLSNWINDTLPNIIHQTYELELEEWVWTYRRKGKYKTCSKCGQVKLAVDDRYFSKHSKGKMGLQSMCKVCDKKRKEKS